MVRNSNPFERKDSSRKKKGGGGSWLLVTLGVAVVIILVVALFIPENEAASSSDTTGADKSDTVAAQAVAPSLDAVDGSDAGKPPSKSSANPVKAAAGAAAAALKQFRGTVAMVTDANGMMSDLGNGGALLTKARALLRRNPSQCTNLPEGPTHSDKRDYNMVIKYVAQATNFLELDATEFNLFLTPVIKGKHYSFHNAADVCENKSEMMRCLEGEDRLAMVCVAIPAKASDENAMASYCAEVDKVMEEEMKKGELPSGKIDAVYVGDVGGITMPAMLHALRYADSQTVFLVKNFWSSDRASEALEHFVIVDGATNSHDTQLFGSIVVLRAKPGTSPLARQFAYKQALTPRDPSPASAAKSNGADGEPRTADIKPHNFPATATSAGPAAAPPAAQPVAQPVAEPAAQPAAQPLAQESSGTDDADGEDTSDDS